MTYSTIQYQDIIIWYDCADVVMQVKSRAGYISYIYHLPLYHFIMYISVLYTVFWDSSPHTRLYVWPAFCLFLFVYVDNSRVLSTSSPESGVEVMHSRSRLWSTEPTCRCVYISVVYFISLASAAGISYCISFIYSVHVYPDYYILSLRLWDCVVSFCEIV